MMDTKSWSVHVEFVILFATLVGMFYIMHSESSATNARFDQFMIAHHEEMKDFHARLAVQDQEFKFRMSSMEERCREKK